MEMFSFILLYLSLFSYILYLSIKNKTVDFIFSPWPGYAFIFSTYLLLSTLSMDTEVMPVQWMCYSFALIGFLGGHVLYKYFFKYYRSGKADAQGGGIDRLGNKLSKREFFSTTLRFEILYGLYALSMAATVFMWLKSGVPALSANVDAARVAYLDNGYIATVATFLDIVAVFCFAYLVSQEKIRISAKTVFCFLAIVTFIIVAVLAGSRSRLLKFIVPAVLIFNFFGKGLKVSHLLSGSALGLSFIGFIGFYRNIVKYGESLSHGIGASSDWNIVDYVLFFVKKELKNGAYGLDIVLRTIPDSVQHTYGLLHVGAMLMPLKLGIQNPGDFFKAAIGGNWDGFGLAATFIAPMYTDLSYPGVILFSVVYAFIFTMVFDSIFSKRKSSLFNAVIYGMLFYFMVSGVRSDIVSFEVFWFVLTGYAIKHFSTAMSKNSNAIRVDK